MSWWLIALMVWIGPAVGVLVFLAVDGACERLSLKRRFAEDAEVAMLDGWLELTEAGL